MKLTVGALKRAIASMPDDAWVCLPSGPATAVSIEPGANEPFIIIEDDPALEPWELKDGEAIQPC